MKIWTKENKYENCDEYWLLIREGDMTAASFSKIKIDILKRNLQKFICIEFSKMNY